MNFQYRMEDLSEKKVSVEKIWSGDVLNRGKTAERYEKLISGQDGPLTICLDSEWGGGKTFFLKRFHAQYEKNGGYGIYFNAWEDDDLSDPLIAIVGQLWSRLKDCASSTVINDLKTRGTSAILKLSLRVAKAIPVVGAAIGDDDSRMLQSGTQNAFDDYLECVEAKRALRDSLSTLAEDVYKEKGRPLLFIVDELDRCRPTFAVELLERVKHLLSVPHIIFLFGADCEQLGHCVRAVYGDIDAQDYLLRFFDVKLKLPKTNVNRFFESRWEDANTFSRGESAEWNRGLLEPYGKFREDFSKLLECNHFSLRQIEYCLRIYEMLVCSDRSNLARWTWLNAILVVMRIKHEKLYRRFVACGVSPSLLVDTLLDGAPGDLDVFEHCSNLMRIIFLSYMAGAFGEMYSKEVREDVDEINAAQSLPTSLRHFPACFRTYPLATIKSFYASLNEQRASHYSQLANVGNMVLKIDEMLDCMECDREEW